MSGGIAHIDEAGDTRDHVALRQERRMTLVRHFQHVELAPPRLHCGNRRRRQNVGEGTTYNNNIVTVASQC